MDAQKNLYREEAYELLEGLENALLELERHPNDIDIVGRVFRAMHTIKGSGAMFGFDDIAAFTHTVETVYDLIREGRLAVTEALISLTLQACDQVRSMLDASHQGTVVDEARTQELTAAFHTLIPGEPDQETPDRMLPEADRQAGMEENRMVTYRIRFRPARDLFENGTNPVPLLNELREMGLCTIVSRMDDLPVLTEMDPERCYIGWDIVLTTTSDASAVRDVFIFVEDISDISIETIDTDPHDGEDPGYKKVGEILLERGAIGKEDLESALDAQRRIGEVLVANGAVRKSEVASALLEQDHVRSVKRNRFAAEDTSSIRVPSARLDALVNLVGELVTVQARLTQFSAKKSDPDLIGIAEEVERLSAELRDISMGIRMLPIGSTFAKFRRLVRDLSAELKKDIRFTMEGEDTELDKTVIDRLSEPLVHLIRNSIDHGIEHPDERAAAGKPAQGTISLSAEHSGAHVLITVTDDGAGLDTDAIRAKAIEKGIIAPDAAISVQALHDLVFTPAFSTASRVTSVSGRGVGMDVVRSSMDSLGGSAEIRSTRGKGTTITLKLPLTLAIIDGLLVNIDCDSFVIPLSAVVECVELTDAARSHVKGRHLIRVRQDVVPYIPLRDVFAIGASDVQEPEQVVITELGGRRVGFVVDKVIGQHQTVIKTMGGLLKGVDGISGATILGDGSVALIVDVLRLMQQQEHLLRAVWQ